MDSTIMRIYMTASAKVDSKKLSTWQRIFNNSLSSFTLKKAQESGIEQAIIQKIPGGYLKGKKMAFDMVEVVPPDLPQCVELIDSENKLRSFFEKFKDNFQGCKVVLFKTAELINQN